MNKKKRIIITVSILSVLAIGLGIVIASASVRNSYFAREYGACLSITVFDKWKLDDVDRVVIDKRDRRIEITGKDLIDDIIGETAIATHAVGDIHGDEYTIELYIGDKLLRSMPWAVECCGGNIVTVYEEDLTHWFCNRGIGVDDAEWGYVYLSRELVDTLMALE